MIISRKAIPLLNLRDFTKPLALNVFECKATPWLDKIQVRIIYLLELEIEFVWKFQMLLFDMELKTLLPGNGRIKQVPKYPYGFFY